MANKFARKKFYTVIERNGVKQFDYLSFQWLRFDTFLRGRKVETITITQEFEARLDLLAHKYYGNVHLWWIIARANDILDPLNDVSVGKKLIIPALIDIEDFFQTIINRRQQRGEVLLPRIEV